jgi:hypothetical protein
LAVELGSLASRHSLDLDRALALTLQPAFSGQLHAVELDLGVIQGSWSKSKSMIMIKKMKAQSWHDGHPPLFLTKSTAYLRGDARFGICPGSVSRL